MTMWRVAVPAGMLGIALVLPRQREKTNGDSRSRVGALSQIFVRKGAPL